MDTDILLVDNAIYPAHAGINLSDDIMLTLRLDLPRTRGDKPANHHNEGSSSKSTPHTRG